MRPLTGALSLLGPGCWDRAALRRVTSWVWGSPAVPACSCFFRRQEAPGNAGKPKIPNWALICPGWREHEQWCLWLLCPRKFWQVLQGSLSLPASSVGLVVLLFVVRFHSVFGCLKGVIAACIPVHLILLTEGVSSASFYAVAILDLSLYSQLLSLFSQWILFILMLGSWERSSGLKGWPAALPYFQHYFNKHSCMIKKINSQQALFSYQYMTRLYLSWVFKVPLEM